VGSVSAQATQIHDYEPGIQDNGVFWTVPIAPSAITHDLASGAATYSLHDYDINDYTSFPKSLTGVVTAPAVVSFDLTLEPSAKQRRYEQVDKDNGFRGEFIEGGDAKIAWSSKQDGFEFTSDAADTSLNLFSILGTERNGVFFDSASVSASSTTSTTTPPGHGRLPATGGSNGLAVAGLGALAAAVVGRRMRVARDG
jgi:hypothetical protein